eukprot:scaffold2489_cov259-Pinguiococcus_pyrenoidosus.AAC.12
MRSMHRAVLHHEDVRRIRLADKAMDVQHQRVGGVCVVCLDLQRGDARHASYDGAHYLGDDVVQEVVVVNFGVHAHRRVPSVGRRDQRDALAIVVRCDRDHGLELCEDHESGAEGVELGVHGTRGLLPACQRQSDPLKVSLKHEDSAVVHAEPFPDGVSALHRRVEDGDPREGSRHQAGVSPFRPDVDEDVAIPWVWVQALQHAVINDGSLGCSRLRDLQGLLPQVLVDRQGCREDASELRSQRFVVTLLPGAAVPASRAVDGRVPILRPQAVAVLGPLRPSQHGLLEGNPDRLAKRSQGPFRIAAQVFIVYNHRLGPLEGDGFEGLGTSC